MMPFTQLLKLSQGMFFRDVWNRYFLLFGHQYNRPVKCAYMVRFCANKKIIITTKRQIYSLGIPSEACNSSNCLTFLFKFAFIWCVYVGFYAYIEASWPRRAGNVARLVSPVLNGTQCMRFYYNMFGRFMGDLQIYVEHKKSMIFLWGRYKNQGVGWHSTNVTVYGNDYKVQCKWIQATSFHSEMTMNALNGFFIGCKEQYGSMFSLFKIALQKILTVEPITLSFIMISLRRTLRGPYTDCSLYVRISRQQSGFCNFVLSARHVR